MAAELIIRHLGQQDYLPVWRAMQQFTDIRTLDTADEIWLLEHPPVFTLGQAGKAEHLLDTGNIPVIQIDRGGQVTYHGPGQRVVYLLLDLKRLGLGVRRLVEHIEQVVIDLLGHYGIRAEGRREAPGVYVAGSKVAALGLRVRRSGSYHGLSLNIDMDLEPFNRINPCGYPNMPVTQLRGLINNGKPIDTELLAEIDRQLLDGLTAGLGYAKISTASEHTIPTPAVPNHHDR